MPKEVIELNNFNVGTVTTPDVRDIPVEAASYSLNLDSVVEDGLLRGVPADAEKYTEGTSGTGGNTNMKATTTSTIQRNDSTRDVVYYNMDDNELNMIKDFEGTPDTISGSTAYEGSVSSVIVSSGDEVCLETNNREVHAGTGSASTDVPKWLGWIDFGQFGGSAPSNAVLENAELSSLDSFPALYKTIYKQVSSVDYIYGIEYQGNYLYKIKISDGTITRSTKRFTSTQGLAECGDGTFWVYDGKVGAEGTLYKLDTTTMAVTQTNKLLCSAPLADNIITDGLLTDIQETGSVIWWSAYAINAQQKNTNTGNVHWLFKCTEPTDSSNIDVVPITPTWTTVSEGGVDAHDSSSPSDSSNANTRGLWTTHSDGTIISGGPTLRFYKTPLVPITSSTTEVGCLVRSTTGTATLIDNNNGSAQTGSGSNHYSRAEPYDSTTDHLALDSFFVIATTSSTDGNEYFASGGNGFGVVSLLANGGSAVSTVPGNAYLSAVNTGHGLHITNFDATPLTTNFIAFDDLSDVNTATTGDGSGGNTRGFKVLEAKAAASNVDEHIKGVLAYSSDDSTNTTIYFTNSEQGGKISEATWTVSGASLGSRTAKTTSGIDITPVATADSTLTSGDTGTFLSTKKYYYKASAVYDGYQEGTLTSSSTIIPNTGTTTNSMNVTINLRNISSLSKRVSHINLYRAESSDLTSDKPDTFYRLVTSLPLDSSWSSVADSFWESASSNTYRQYEHSDNSLVGATYEAINGISEVINSSIVNYALSTQLNGHHVVAKCFHADLPDAERYIFKSKPGKFDQFDWTADFVRLPTIPTAITAFAGRIYAWDENTMYRINLDGMYIEDTYKGIGCIGNQAFEVTEYGMCFCDHQNIYLHDGKQPMIISENIKDGDSVVRPKNLDGDQFDTLDVSWDGKAASGGANKAGICIEFDSKRGSFLIFWGHASSSDPSRAYAWAYNLARKRWDLLAITTSTDSSYVRTTFQDSTGEIYYSDNAKCYKLFGGTTRKSWEYMTKTLSMGIHTQTKKMYGWELRYKRGGSSKTPLVYWSIIGGDKWTHGTHSGSFAESGTVQLTTTKYSHMQGKLRVSNSGAIQTQEARDIKFFICENNTAGSRVDGTVAETEVDSLAVVYRKVKFPKHNI